MVVYLFSFLLGLVLIVWGFKHLKTGKIYVGFGEGYLYGRTWVQREEDPLLFWTLVILLFVFAVAYLFWSFLNFIGDPDWYL